MTEPGPTTPKFAAGTGVGTGWASCAKACLNDLGVLPPGTNLGFLYATDALADDLSSLLAFLRAKTGIAHWTGSVGLGIAAMGKEIYDRPAVSILTAALPEESFRIFSLPGEGADDGGLAAFRQDHHAWLSRSTPIFGVAHGDPRTRDLSGMLNRFAATASAFLVGGLTASRGGLPQIADAVTEGGLSGVLFDSSLAVTTGLTQGCAPIGETHSVTAAQGDVISELDNRPALDVFKEDIGELLAHDLRRVGGGLLQHAACGGAHLAHYQVKIPYRA